MFAYVGGSSFKKPLTAEEETEYLNAMATGDKQARDILIERNMRLVAHIVKKYTSTQQRDADELISVGTIGQMCIRDSYIKSVYTLFFM